MKTPCELFTIPKTNKLMMKTIHLLNIGKSKLVVHGTSIIKRSHAIDYIKLLKIIHKPNLTRYKIARVSLL